jgi:S-formylglutathione hydrolase FrmB
MTRRTPKHWLQIGCAVTLVATTLVGLGVGTAAGSPAASKAKLVTITIPAQSGEIASKWLSYPGPPRANVLLPSGYSRAKHYPLIVFLNGLDFDYDSYARYGLTKPFDHLNAIVVMPEGGNGWFTNWWNDGERGNPSWESYELETVIPAILARYPILPQRRYHALIGISMGGLGATYLGGRLPGFFGSVASLSGFVDTQWNPSVVQPAMAVFSNAASKGDNDLGPIYGPPDGYYSTGHNPTMLAMNLEHTRVFESTGTGTPSKADPDPGQFAIEEEKIIYPMSQSYDTALATAGIDVTYQVHPGGHDIPDFLDEIRAMLSWGLFKPVVNEPKSWDNQTVATRGQLWDVSYRFAKPPTQIVTFHQSGSMLSISAAGSAVTITTGAGCTVRASTPTTITVTGHSCR